MNLHTDSPVTPPVTPPFTSPPTAPCALQPARAQWLSAFVDGELSAAEADAFAKDVARDDALGARFASYSWIGDALRSPELAVQGSRDDAQFLQRMRAALAAEPVVLTPAALPPAVSTESASKVSPSNFSLRTWGAGVASVAGVAALVFALSPRGAPTAPELAFSSQAPVAGAVVAVSAAPAAALQVVNTTSGKMIRDPQLDQYLQAHHRLGGTVAAPAAFVRSQKAQAVACVEC